MRGGRGLSAPQLVTILYRDRQLTPGVREAATQTVQRICELADFLSCSPVLCTQVHNHLLRLHSMGQVRPADGSASGDSSAAEGARAAAETQAERGLIGGSSTEWGTASIAAARGSGIGVRTLWVAAT